jgi:hypothetical protein
MSMKQKKTGKNKTTSVMKYPSRNKSMNGITSALDSPHSALTDTGKSVGIFLDQVRAYFIPAKKA